jgi:hypothetical protein
MRLFYNVPDSTKLPLLRLVNTLGTKKQLLLEFVLNEEDHDIIFFFTLCPHVVFSCSKLIRKHLKRHSTTSMMR